MGVFERTEGILAGHAVTPDGGTGVSVFLFPDGAVASAEVRGFAAGTRQFDSLSLTHSVDEIHGVVFAGGSVFGHSAAQSVVLALAERGIGLSTDHGVVPVVPSAVIYDLGLGGGREVDYGSLGLRALERAFSGDPEGYPGAGAGATVGKLLGVERATKTSAGGAEEEVEGVSLGVFVVLNSFGEVVDRNGEVIAGIRGEGQFERTMELFSRGADRRPFRGGDSTTLTLIATDGVLSHRELHYFCVQANNFLAGRIRPYGTVYDGDVVVAVATGKRGRPVPANRAISLVERLLGEAIDSAVRDARGMRGIPSAVEFLSQGGSQ
ncbi:MAG: peptidase S58 family protein [Deltaproteobacteria bacterium]|nr:MAG: peptidase S58 family protein [Deltaproteobacteria bacterium]